MASGSSIAIYASSEGKYWYNTRHVLKPNRRASGPMVQHAGQHPSRPHTSCTQTKSPGLWSNGVLDLHYDCSFQSGDIEKMRGREDERSRGAKEDEDEDEDEDR